MTRRIKTAIVLFSALATAAGGAATWGRYVDQRAVEVAQRQHAAVCARAPACSASGLCGARMPAVAEAKPECIAESDAACAASPGCAARGACRAKDGVCSALADADCASSTICESEGQCHAEAGACHAVSDDDCRAWKGCATAGRCAAENGKCVVSDAGCRAAPLCAEWGFCAAVNGQCDAGSAADCQSSTWCKLTGQCLLGPGPHPRCLVDEASCRASVGCQNSGDCALGFVRESSNSGDEAERRALDAQVQRSDARECVALLDEHCQQSKNCKKYGLCVVGTGAHRDRCVAGPVRTR